MNRFFKKFKKFVKNSRQDRIYKERGQLPDTQQNLKTYGIPLYGYGIPNEKVKKPIKDLNQKNQTSKIKSKKTKTQPNKATQNKNSYLKEVKTTKKLDISKAKKKKECAKKNIEVKNYSDALKNLNESIEINNSDYETYLLRGEVKIHLKDFNSVMENYNDAKKWGASNFALVVLKWKFDFSEKRFDEALKNITEFIDSNNFSDYAKTRYSICYRLRGYCHENLGNHKVAIKDLSTFVDFIKEDVKREGGPLFFDEKKQYKYLYKTYLELGALNSKIKDFEKSISIYKSLINLVKDEEKVIGFREQIAILSEKIFDYDESISQYSKLISNFPYEYEFYKERAKLKKITNDLEGCKIDKKIARILKKEITTERELTNYKSIELLNKLIKVDPNNQEFISFRADNHENGGDYDLGIEDLSKLIYLNAKDAENYYKRALLHKKNEDFESALEDLTNTIKIESKHFDAFINRALIQIGLNNFKDARDDLLHVISNDPVKNLFCYFVLAEISLKENSKSKDIRTFENALKYCDNALASSEISDSSIVNIVESQIYALKCAFYFKCGISFGKYKKEIINVFEVNSGLYALSRYFSDEEIAKIYRFYDRELNRERIKKREIEYEKFKNSDDRKYNDKLSPEENLRKFIDDEVDFYLKN